MSGAYRTPCVVKREGPAPRRAERALDDARIQEGPGCVLMTSADGGGASMGSPPQPSAARAPEARAPVGAGRAEPEVDVVAVGERHVDALAQTARAGVADGVGPERRHALRPVAAVPDDLLDAHAAREGLRAAEAVGRQQQPDEAAGGAAVRAARGVEVPV